jgi:hypothetical protein
VRGAGPGPVLSAQRRRLARGPILDHDRSAIGRANFAAALVDGAHVGLGTSFDPIALAAHHGQGRNPSFFAQLLLGADGPEVALDAPGPARQALVRLLASPEAQRI